MRRSIAPAATWRTGSRNAKATCSPTEPRPPRCAPTSCGSGSPRSPMFSSARSGASALRTRSSPRRPAARSGSSFSSSQASSASARAASNSPSLRPVLTPKNGASPPPASPEASPRRRQIAAIHPRPTGDAKIYSPIRANGAKDALVPRIKLTQSLVGLRKIDARGEKCGLAALRRGLLAQIAAEKRCDAHLRNRRAEQEALHLSDRSEGLDDPHLSFRLDALDKHGHAELAAHRRDALHEDRGALLDAETDGEGPIDLDAVEREAEEIAQARIAGAEVVERNAHAVGPNGLKSAAHIAAIVKQRRLGDLEVQSSRGKIRGAKSVADRLHDVSVADLRRGQVDRNADVLRPRGASGAGAAQH